MKKISSILATSLLLFMASAAFAQKDSEIDNGGGSTGSATPLNSARAGFTPDSTRPLPNRAEIMENFDDITTLPGDGWAFKNNSDAPNLDWFQGNPAVFTAQSGADDAYIGANFNSTSGSTISNWMITPELNLSTLDTFSFWARTVTGNTFPDRMEVRLSTNGSSIDVGSTTTSVGDFTELLLSINPNLQSGGFPDTWTQFILDDFSAFSGTGRIAFRYWVTDGGPVGSNSNFIGVDTLETTEVTCSVTSVAIAGVDGNDVTLAISGDCADGVSIRADATGDIVATNVIVSGTTYVDVEFFADSTYTAILPGGAEVTSNTATVPTLGEWGMISFMLLLMGSGLYFLRKRRLA